METPETTTLRSYFDASTLDYLLEGFQIIDFEWKYVYVNDSVVKQSKFSREELIGKTMMEKYPGIEKTEMFQSLELCMEERKPKRMENQFTFPDGTIGWFELHMQPVPEGVCILSNDISIRKNAEELLRKMKDSLEDMVALRTEQLEAKNKDILDSLYYAKSIQKAFLPSKTDLNIHIPEAFIINKPKDIVSGDFYWYSQKDNNIFIAVGDCTGHGVPAALVSMVAIEKLSGFVAKNNDPAEILKKMNQSIKLALNSDEDNYCHDGMDIAVCCIDSNKNILKYSGANRPLWIIRKNADFVEVIQPTKSGIGGETPSSKEYKTEEIQLQTGDTFYIFSDGYADTFSGTSGKKLTTKKFKGILLSIQKFSMSEQEKYLDDFIEKWKADMEQIDDILVMGVRM